MSSRHPPRGVLFIPLFFGAALLPVCSETVLPSCLLSPMLVSFFPLLFSAVPASFP